MSLRNRLVLPILLSGLAALAGCGSTNSAVPPPSGAFSNTDFSGTYTFSIEGSDPNGGMSIAGSFVACGCTGGTIAAGGVVDFDDASLVAPGSAIGGNSTYGIQKDGRGTANLFITPTGGTAFLVTVDFVLTSSSHGLITRYDGAGTGSGTIDLQASAVAQSSLDVAPYAFTLSGSDSSSDIISTVGSLTLNSSGTITAGVEDCNVTGTVLYQSTLSGSVLVGSGTTPGSATILTACSSGALTFDVYTIDSTHLKLIESDGAAFLVGDAFAQTSATIPQGGLVFTMAGLDSLSSSGAPFVSGGTVVSDGASQLTGGLEDVNDDTTIDGGVTPAVPLNFGGTFVASPSGSGRFQLALSNFFGGTNFAAYPSSGGIFLVQIDQGIGAGVTSGMALPQTAGAAIAATQGYGLNNQGVDFNTGSELDEIAQFTTTSTGMTGLLDDNDGGSVNTSNVNGTYTAADSNGAGTATIGSRLQSINYYAADSSTVLFISTDPNQIAAGVFEAQSAPGGDNESPAVRPRALPMFRALPRSRKGAVRSQVQVRPAKQLGSN
ncbi:MAG: hypothetical protein ABSF93_05190 [Candidatus Sulfotelmatobacter sp.]